MGLSYVQLVLLSYTEVLCKKQGQAWGQGKSRGRYSEDGHNRNGKMENRPSEGTVEQSPSEGVVADNIVFERFPLLSCIPVVYFSSCDSIYVSECKL